MDELKNVSPELSKLKKENPFEVPKGYFDDFSSKLKHKLEEEIMEVPQKRNTIVRILKPALSLAASFALIFMLVYWPLNNFFGKDELQADSSNQSIEDEFNNIVEGMDDYSFYAVLEDENGTIELTDEDLMAYVSANFSEYDLYNETENK